MATIQRVNLENRVKNDTFGAVNMTFTGVDLTGSAIRIMFRYRSKTGTVVKDISSGSGITVTGATDGEFTIDAFTPVDWAVDTYYYDVQITNSSSEVNTYLWGTVNIIQDITYA